MGIVLQISLWWNQKSWQLLLLICRFSVAWWSYTFPMTTASVATVRYAEDVPSSLSKGLAITLSFMSSTMVSVLFISTLLHAFVWQTLFPNDLAIAITKKRVLSKEKKPFKRAYDIKRWTKQALTKQISVKKEFEAEKEGYWFPLQLEEICLYQMLFSSTSPFIAL